MEGWGGKLLFGLLGGREWCPCKREPEVGMCGEGEEVGNTHRWCRMSPCTSNTNQERPGESRSPSRPQSWTHCPVTTRGKFRSIQTELNLGTGRGAALCCLRNPTTLFSFSPKEAEMALSKNT